MGLITKEVEIVLSNKIIKHYEDLGYIIPRYIDNSGRLKVKYGTKIKVKVYDLTKSSNVKVDVKCDKCGEILTGIVWKNYLISVKDDDKYYCKKCANILFGVKTIHETKLRNGKSFEQWCIENNRQDVFDRWDYELNDCKPSDILYGTKINYYFKCPRGIHNSELNNIVDFTCGVGSIKCNTCNSFAQWGINNLGEDFLEKYWDYKKNHVNPWEIAKSVNKHKVWIKCQEKDYHGSYTIVCSSFITRHRCSYCANHKVHPLDSLGKLLEDKGLLYLWSDKNKKSPFEYKPNSGKYVYWKCPKSKHEDYKRKISHSDFCGFRCPECQYSKGEERISNYLIDNNFIKLYQEEFTQLIDNDKYNKNYYMPQKKFYGLLGLGNGNLSYDFYLPYFNLLIEYQGEFHDGTAYQQSEADYKIQVEHDRRKREYTQINNIKLLEIWYYDFDNIEEILDKKLLSSDKKEGDAIWQSVNP